MPTEPDVTYKLPCRTAPSGCNAFSVASLTQVHHMLKYGPGMARGSFPEKAITSMFLFISRIQTEILMAFDLKMSISKHKFNVKLVEWVRIAECCLMHATKIVISTVIYK